MPISLDTQPSDLGFYFAKLTIWEEKHQPPSGVSRVWLRG